MDDARSGVHNSARRSTGRGDGTAQAMQAAMGLSALAAGLLLAGSAFRRGPNYSFRDRTVSSRARRVVWGWNSHVSLPGKALGCG